MPSEEELAQFDAAVAAMPDPHAAPPSRLLEALQASLAAQGQPPAPEDQAALDARLAAAQAQLAGFLAWVDDGRDKVFALWDLTDCLDVADLLTIVRAITDKELGVTGALRDLSRRAEQAVGDVTGKGAVLDSTGLPMAMVDKTRDTRWDHAEAWGPMGQAIRKADRLVINAEDGEMEDDTARALRCIKDAVGVSYLKVGKEGVGGLKDLGLDPDDYRETGPWRWIVRLP